LVHLVAYARHFSPPILTFRVAVHNRSQEARFGEIYDTGFSVKSTIPDSPSSRVQKRPRPSIGSIFWNRTSSQCVYATL
jgi:hypothetical protein